jgi:hypothetical protein
MRFKHLNLQHYLSMDMDDKLRAAIISKLDLILNKLHCKIDSQPVDYYRLLGQCYMRLKIVTELNNLILYHLYDKPMLKPWVFELYDIKEECDAMIKTTEEILCISYKEGYNL